MHRAMGKMPMFASNVTADSKTPSNCLVKWQPSPSINGLQPLRNHVCEALKLSSLGKQFRWRTSQEREMATIYSHK
ncbi:hypothetical protein ACOSP7_002609 [Xanthoceras sorbifolium]